MNIRLGYVAMTLGLEDCSPSGTVTVAALNRLPDEDARLYRLRKVTKRNLENTLRILRYNKAYDIKVYRLTSKLVPLATHAAASGWDYSEEFAQQFREIGDFIKENEFRVSAHPDHYTLINSVSGEVFSASLADLDYHVRVFEAMGLEDYRYKLVIHTGGLYGDKKASLERFRVNFIKLPDRIRKRITLENDDKSFTASDVLGLCKELGIPMVLDVHHHNCANEGEKLGEMLDSIFDTWRGEFFKPKVHFSSPKSCTEFRSHADFIDLDEFRSFLSEALLINTDFDVMLEAKGKDKALFRLSEQLSGSGTVKKINTGEFEISGEIYSE